MANRPDFNASQRQRTRLTGELGGPMDPRANYARHLAAQQNQRYSVQLTRTGFHVVESLHDTREIMGTESMDAVTAAVWHKVTSGQTPTGNWGVMAAADSVTGNAYGMFWVAGPELYFWKNSTTAANRSSASIGTPNDWHHYCGTYDRNDGSGETIRLFVDGDNSGSTNGTGTTVHTYEPATRLVIGAQFWRSTSTTSYGEGFFRDLMIWNRQLTSGEVVSLYNGGAPPNALPTSLASGLRLWWKMGDTPRERVDGIVVDVTGNGFHGRLRSHQNSGTVTEPTFELEAP